MGLESTQIPLSPWGLSPGPNGVSVWRRSTTPVSSPTASAAERAMGPGNECRDDSLREARASLSSMWRLRRVGNEERADRESVVSGKSGSGGAEFGGRSRLKQNKKQKEIQQ